MEFQYITEQNELDAAITQYQETDLLMIDTEFMRRRTLYPELALIQIYDGNLLTLIDPCCDLALDGFWALMTNREIVKVLHSPSEDLEVIHRFGHCIPTPLFDTQFALSLLGHGASVGFAHMVNKLLNLEIDKSESRTNWLQRPLTAKQLDYAASDVFHLLPCYQQLLKEINDKGLLSIVYGESALVAKKRTFKTPAERLYLDVKNSWQLNPADLAMLQALSIWRRNKAEKKNLALSFILKEPTLLEIAKRKPQSFSQLKRVPGIEQVELNRSGKEILSVIETTLKVSCDLYPSKIKRLVDFPGYKKEFKAIKQRLTQVATVKGIPVEVIASKKQINQILSWKWKLNDAERETLLVPDLQTGWRKALLGDALKNWVVE